MQHDAILVRSSRGADGAEARTDRLDPLVRCLGLGDAAHGRQYGTAPRAMGVRYELVTEVPEPPAASRPDALAGGTGPAPRAERVPPRASAQEDPI